MSDGNYNIGKVAYSALKAKSGQTMVMAVINTGQKYLFPKN
jgi:hypothetical protein